MAEKVAKEVAVVCLVAMLVVTAVAVVEGNGIRNSPLMPYPEGSRRTLSAGC